MTKLRCTAGKGWLKPLKTLEGVTMAGLKNLKKIKPPTNLFAV